MKVSTESRALQIAEKNPAVILTGRVTTHEKLPKVFWINSLRGSSKLAYARHRFDTVVFAAKNPFLKGAIILCIIVLV